MKSYAFGKENVYYFGNQFCPGTWNLKTVKIKDIAEMDSLNDVVILSSNESEELENEIEKKFLSYSKYLASSEEVDFVIYETECQKCKK